MIVIFCTTFFFGFSQSGDRLDFAAKFVSIGFRSDKCLDALQQQTMNLVCRVTCARQLQYRTEIVHLNMYAYATIYSLMFDRVS